MVKTVKALIAAGLLLVAMCPTPQAEDIAALLKKTQIAVETEDMDEAERLCQEILSINSNVYPAYNILGFIYASREGEQQRAISYLERSLNIVKEQPMVYTQIASLYNQMGDLDTAIEYMEKGLEMDPGDYQLNYNLGLMYFLEKHDPYKASECFIAAGKKEPKDERLLYITGFNFVVMGDKAKALEYVTRLRNIKSEYLASRLEASMREKEEGNTLDVTGAMQDYTVAPQHAPDGSTPPQGPAVTASGEPATTVTGTGELTIKQTFKRK
ncbi:MAG: tetratricopeptide repeat protein [Candidatus Omnitrophica bacterium]|nr:tetratricopeptide repeat protein [Candidatus Omnitrophota bacterium]MDD5488750.1 tetratricopeptide repeat protein [Candidatus Omnitrophota bacterium]